MIATVNLPGSQHFDYHVGTKQDCEAFLLQKEIEYKARFGGAWYSAYSPARIVPNSVGRRWKFRDGSNVIKGI